MAEAFNSLFKAECIRNPVMRPTGGWKNVGDVEIAVAEYVDWFNHRRLHGEIGRLDDAAIPGEVLQVQPDDLVIDLQTQLLQLVKEAGGEPLVAAPADRGRRTGGISGPVGAAPSTSTWTSLSNTTRSGIRGR